MTSETGEPVEGEQLKLFPGFVAFAAGKDEMNIAEFPIAALATGLWSAAVARFTAWRQRVVVRRAASG